MVKCAIREMWKSAFGGNDGGSGAATEKEEEEEEEKVEEEEGEEEPSGGYLATKTTAMRESGKSKTGFPEQ